MTILEESFYFPLDRTVQQVKFGILSLINPITEDQRVSSLGGWGRELQPWA